MPGVYPLNHTFALAENASATPPGDTVWPGGTGMFTGEATFGGGSITLQVLTPNGTWVAVGSDTTLTAAGAAGFILPNGARIRASIAIATAVFAYASQIP